jgi:uncharacterized cysteine cluster protein YcgN (CxxCxxCC family)
MGGTVNREWEARCRRCGQCCFEKWIEADGRIRFTRVPCRHLDMTTRTCRVYAKRLEVGEGCVQLTPENVAQLHWLPADCAYVELLAGGPPAKTDRRRRQVPASRRKRGRG